MVEDDIGYYEHPKNGWGIKRARTTKQLRSWEIARELRSLEAINKEEFGGVAYPAIYILFVGKNKVYIGEDKRKFLAINSGELWRKAEKKLLCGEDMKLLLIAKRFLSVLAVKNLKVGKSHLEGANPAAPLILCKGEAATSFFPETVCC